MPTITADRVVNKDIYAKGTVNAFGNDLLTVKKTFTNKQLIGKVFSWITAMDGNIYWLVYLTPADYANFKPVFIKHDAGSLSLPALPYILEQITSEKEQAEKEKKGLVGYYIEKYAPYIVGGVVLAIALPAVTKSISTKKINGMNENQKLMGIAAAGIVVYLLTKKKRKGSIIIDPLDQGEFVPDPKNKTNSLQSSVNATGILDNIFTGGGGSNNETGTKPLFVGAFPVVYEQSNTIAGRKNLGTIRTN